MINRREFIVAGAAALAAARLPRKPFVAHEWGVITVPAGATWANLRTVSGESPTLPPFVTQWSSAAGKLIEEWKNAPVIVDKPVIHFYTDARRTVNVRVRVPTGRPKAWWPPASEFGPKPELPARELRGMRWDPGPAPNLEDVKPENGFLAWNGLTIDPGADPKTLREADGWWKTAREIPSAVVGGAERFIFYDALTPFDPGELPEPNVRVSEGKSDGLTPADFEAMLLDAGLYMEEAARVTEIWTSEFFETDGHRVLTLLPREKIDALLPLSIDPAPDDLVRVLIVHVECLTPAQREAVAREIARLGADDPVERDAAMEALAARGPTVEAALRSARAETRDEEVRVRVARLLERLGID